ncbi:o-succinylbenzoate synthase [Haloarculaceae archaeon H-GB2-1]|nr:o-succinylbenzoate synthase [Haloarculaceae archaeon H-GB1-1]MEA5408795.1 o-succinylbenzoate synthase [Haloarculaceae archaeon H-GB2-1]
MRIEPFSLSLESPLEMSQGRITDREGFVVRVERDGERGLGEATPLPGWTESHEECAGALERAIEADAAGANPLAPLDDAPAARHGVELALADAVARAADQPLYRSLGGDRSVEYVPVNATIGDGDVDETVEAASDAVERGVSCLKVKVGARSVDEDVQRLRAVREAVGSSVELRADANGGWTRAEAEAAFEALEPLGVAYVEQPLSADDLAGLAALRGGGVGVAADETLVSESVEAVIDAGAADVLVLKPMALGGVRRARARAMRALDAGLLPVVTTTIDAVVARTAAVHLAASLPDAPACGLATAELLAEDLADDPAPVEDGTIRVPQGKGLGVAGPIGGNDVR